MAWAWKISNANSAIEGQRNGSIQSGSPRYGILRDENLKITENFFGSVDIAYSPKKESWFYFMAFFKWGLYCKELASGHGPRWIALLDHHASL